MEKAKAHTSVPAPWARACKRRANDQVCLRPQSWGTIKTASGHGLHRRLRRGHKVGVKGRRGLQYRRHEATRSRDHLDVHWTWALGMEARAVCAGKIQVQVRGSNLQL